MCFEPIGKQPSRLGRFPEGFLPSFVQEIKGEVDKGLIFADGASTVRNKSSAVLIIGVHSCASESLAQAMLALS